MKYLIVIASILTLFSCKKAEDRTCAKSVGEKASLELALPNFDKLFVGPKVEVVLVQDTINKLVIEGGKNLIKHISADMDEKNYLKIENKNKCSVFRSYKKSKIRVEVHFVSLKELMFEGTYDLTTSHQFSATEFKLEIRDSGATVYLDIAASNLHVYQGHGFGDFVINGTATNAFLYVISNGYGNTEGLTVANDLIVSSNTPVASTFNFSGAKTKVEILGSGNVYYIGEPASLQFQRVGEGELIKKG
jgi:hypothetical protein